MNTVRVKNAGDMSEAEIPMHFAELAGEIAKVEKQELQIMISFSSIDAMKAALVKGGGNFRTGSDHYESLRGSERRFIHQRGVANFT